MTCEIARSSGKKSGTLHRASTPNKKKNKTNGDLAGGFKYVLFSPLPGEMIQFD